MCSSFPLDTWVKAFHDCDSTKDSVQHNCNQMLRYLFLETKLLMVIHWKGYGSCRNKKKKKQNPNENITA